MLRVLHHGAEFIDVKFPAMQAETALLEDGGAFALQLDRHGCEQHKGREHDQRDGRNDRVDQSFSKASVHGSSSQMFIVPGCTLCVVLGLSL